MMTVFESLRFKNILSFGDNWTEISLTRSPNTLIIGRNGAGKSAIFEALHFALFGSPIRPVSKKGQLVNNKNNKGLLVELRFCVGDKSYMIRRGMKPDVFEIYQDNVLINQEASVRDSQNRLNRDILKMDKVGFQITSQVSKASPIQMFMSLSTPERRVFIDNMLESFIFTEMSKIQKVNVDTAKTKFDETLNVLTKISVFKEAKDKALEDVLKLEDSALDDAVKRKESSIKSIEEKIECLKSSISASKISESNILGTMDKTEQEIGRLKEEIKNLTDSIPKVDTERLNHLLKESENISSSISSKKGMIRQLEKTIDGLKEGKCPKCLTVVDSNHIEKHRSDIELEILEIVKEIDKAEESLKQFKESIELAEKLENEASALRAKVSDIISEKSILDFQYQSSKKDLERVRLDIAGLEKELDANISLLDATRGMNPVPDSYIIASRVKLQEECQELVGMLAKAEESHNKADENLVLAKAVLDSLKDSGIKAAIVRRYLPTINRVVNEKLAELGMFTKFTLDENFNDTILYNGIHEMSFAQLSEGQKLRINLALILAWREIARLQGRMYSNLLMIDEVIDGSLDDEGYESLTDILKRLEGINLFVISHNPAKMDNFVRSKITVEYDDGFSFIR